MVKVWGQCGAAFLKCGGSVCSVGQCSVSVGAVWSGLIKGWEKCLQCGVV